MQYLVLEGIYTPLPLYHEVFCSTPRCDSDRSNAKKGCILLLPIYYLKSTNSNTRGNLAWKFYLAVSNCRERDQHHEERSYRPHTHLPSNPSACSISISLWRHHQPLFLQALTEPIAEAFYICRRERHQKTRGYTAVGVSVLLKA